MTIEEIVAELEHHRDGAQRMIENTRSRSQSAHAQGEKKAYEHALQLLERCDRPKQESVPSGFDEMLKDML